MDFIINLNEQLCSYLTLYFNDNESMCMSSKYMKLYDDSNMLLINI